MMKKRNLTTNFAMLLTLTMPVCGEDPQINVNFTVFDELGSPVEGAKVEVGFQILSTGKRSGGEVKTTDENGSALLFGSAFYSPAAVISKAGYYDTRVDFIKTFVSPPEVKETVYLKENSVEVILKSKRDPIQLYVKRVEGGIPIRKERAGYDFERGDWVSPHGIGEVTDIYLTLNYDESTVRNEGWNIEVDFPNEKDGILPFESNTEFISELRSDYQAPIEGYQSNWVFNSRIDVDGHVITNTSKTRCYYLRVRVSLDDKGEIVSANYGKIYGDFKNFIYYFNPNSDDRNIEFDPEKNLLGSDSRLTRIRYP